MRRSHQPNRVSSHFGMNLTSMTDVFTILLVFLLQSYSTNQEIINPESGLRLPSSNSSLDTASGLKLTVSKDNVRIGSTIILHLKDGQLKPEDRDKNDGLFIPNLHSALLKEANQHAGKKDLEEKLFMQADASLPYSTLQPIFYTASQAGYPQLKIATLLGE